MPKSQKKKQKIVFEMHTGRQIPRKTSRPEKVSTSRKVLSTNKINFKRPTKGKKTKTRMRVKFAKNICCELMYIPDNPSKYMPGDFLEVLLTI